MDIPPAAVATDRRACLSTAACLSVSPRSQRVPCHSPRHTDNASAVFIDDREGVEEVRMLGLSATGLLAILDQAALRGLIDLADAITRLRQTNFRVNLALLERLLRTHVPRT